MSTIEFADDPQVGELKFVRNSELLDKSEYIYDECDCADPGTGGDDCSCEDG